MRIFSPFAVLGLLHVARGGELDSFSGDRARQIRENLRNRNSSGVSGSSDPSPPPNTPHDLPLAFQKVQERSEHHRRAFDKMDTNSDGYIDSEEILKSLEFWLGDAHSVRRVLRTFGIQDIDETFEAHTPGEKRMPKPQFLDIAERRPMEGSEQTSHCPALQAKIESCELTHVIKCTKYLHAASMFCNAGHHNTVETCIMSERCSNICDCISAAEDAAHGNGEIVDQQGVAILPQTVDLAHSGNGLHPRLFWLIWAIIGAIVSFTLAAVVKDIQRDYAEVAWLNSVFWDGKGTPPTCSTYVYWGSCHYIGTAKSRRCPGGGERIYKNSCKDHFRYGSQGCSGVKCQSLCAKTNPEGCPCSVFDWTHYVDQDMPGFDLPNSSFFTQLVSECRDACAKRPDCKTFVITPPKGNKDDKSHNCWLKSAQRVTQRSDGVVTFFRKGQGGSKCGKETPIFSDGTYDGDWWPEGSSNKRDTSGLVPRASGDKVPFLYDARNQAYFIASLFVAQLYQSWLNNDLTWQRNPELRGSIGESELNRRITYGLPSNPPYVANPALPRWNPVELGYRIRTVFSALFDLARNRVDNPVRTYLARTPQGTDAEYAQFPRTVRELLEANSDVIHASSRDINDIWVGTDHEYVGRGAVAPYPGIQVGYDSRLTYWQGGNAGPFSIEAAFILATQLAGVNFRNLARAAERPNQRHGDPWWMGIMATHNVQPTELYTEDSNGCQRRQYGRVMRSGGHGQHDPDAGVYMAFDLNPDLPATDENRNVFVFVVHAIDRSSVIEVPQDRILREIRLNRYTPSVDSGVYNADTPNGGGAPAPPATDGTDRTRVFAHAHAGIVPLASLETWLTSSSGRFPIYDQISAGHLYILTEDDTIFPRRQWMRDNEGGPGSS